MTCNKDVKVKETVLTKDKKFVKYQLLEGTDMLMQAIEESSHARVHPRGRGPCERVGEPHPRFRILLEGFPQGARDVLRAGPGERGVS